MRMVAITKLITKQWPTSIINIPSGLRVSRSCFSEEYDLEKHVAPAQCQAADVVVKIRIHCQLNTPASLQSPALPHYVIFSAQPIVVRTNKILLTNFYFFGKFSSSSCSHCTLSRCLYELRTHHLP